MVRKRKKGPSLVRHKPTGHARVRINERDFSLGKWGLPETEERHRRLIPEGLAQGQLPDAPQKEQEQMQKSGTPSRKES